MGSVCLVLCVCVCTVHVCVWRLYRFGFGMCVCMLCMFECADAYGDQRTTLGVPPQQMSTLALELFGRLS